MRCLLALLALVFLPAAHAEKNYKHVESFQEVEQVVAAEIAEHGAEHVMVVFDTDDTLLTSNSDLGGVSWFDWQNELLTKEPNSKYLVAKSFSGLLQAQLMLFERNQMKLTNQRIPVLLQAWADSGVSLLVETARGPSMKRVTEQHLLKNALEDKAKPGKTIFSVAGQNQLDFTDACQGIDLKRLAYTNGVFYVSGQDKGLALACLSQHGKLQMKSIVFVDDKSDNAKQMCSHLPDQQYDELNCLHFRQLTADQEHFLSDKARQLRASSEWEQLKQQAKFNQTSS